MESQSTVVCVRLRPASSKETGVRTVRPEGDNCIHFTNPDKSISAYAYDKVYGEETTQEQVFQDCKHIVSSVLNGYNGTILAYGQTGSGKTHTLIGSVSEVHLRGMVPRAVQALGEGIAADTSGADYQVRISVVETYCERIRDLLDPTRDNLQVKQDAAGAIFVEGALEARVGSEAQLVEVMHTGLAARTVAATCMNEQSSRSHCIVTVTVEKTCLDGTVLVGKLKMVDLAGSERQDKTHAAGQTLVEGSQINKSLSALANVIYALTDVNNSSSGGSGSDGESSGAAPSIKHVPYRDSKLTRLLQDSLGGTSRTMLIICCSPCLENAPETLSSLRFGSRARGMKNKVTVNTRLSAEVLQQQLTKANARIKELEQQLAEQQLADQQRSTAAVSPSFAGQSLTADSNTVQTTTFKEELMMSSTSCGVAQDLSSLDCISRDQFDAPGLKLHSAPSSKLSLIDLTPGPRQSELAQDDVISRFMSRQIPWWQHLLLTGVSVTVAVAYMTWEASWAY